MHVSFSYLEVFKAKPDQGSLIILMIVNNFTMLSSYYNAQKEKKRRVALPTMDLTMPRSKDSTLLPSYVTGTIK